MPVRDTFPREARWDSVGLDCSYCIYFVGPSTWPDLERVSCCARHELPLAIEFGENGNKLGEWFCEDFGDNGRAHPLAVTHLRSVRENLQPGILYRLRAGGDYLAEFSFEEVRAITT